MVGFAHRSLATEYELSTVEDIDVAVDPSITGSPQFIPMGSEIKAETGPRKGSRPAVELL